MTIHILLAEDHELFRTGLRTMLMQQPDMLVVDEVRDGLDAVRAAVANPPDVVVMDISMPGMNGIEATRRILEVLPAVRVLCLSMYADRRFILSMLEAGAAGYLHKDSALEELVHAIHTVVGNHTYLSPGIADIVVDAYRASQAGETTSALSLLTAREREVLQLIAEGHSTQAIAARLQVSQKTVSTHRENLMSKLAIHSIAGLTKYALQQGLTFSEA